MVVLAKDISPKRRDEMIKGLILQIFLCLHLSWTPCLGNYLWNQTTEC